LSRRDTLLGLAGGFLTGLAGGFFGVGGGAVLIPVLIGGFRLSQHQAHGTSLAVIGGTALVSIVVYGLHGNVAWGTALVVGLATVVTTRIGARLAARTSPRNLTRAFALFLMIVGARQLWKAPEGGGAEVLHGAWMHVAFDIALGLAVGLLSGYMGVGGGILVVPALTLILGWSQQLAQGTSLAVILASAPTGAIEHSRHGNVVGRLVPSLAVGAAIGGPLASWLAQGIDHELLTRAFAVFMLANAASAWIRSGRKTPVSMPGEAGVAPAP
jgi:hypothetical protein